jgi:hypothetical protein
VSYRRKGASVEATIELPAGLEGRFQFAGKEQPLHSGVQHLRLLAP